MTRGLNIGRVTLSAIALLVAASSASGYYHFVHYLTKTSGYTQIREKFDLDALVNSTVTYVIAQSGVEKMADGDSLNSLVSQIHLAARTWSSVPTSRLHLAFGGFVKPGAPSSAPEIEVVFGEVPPGLIATGGPTTQADLAGTDDGKFVPILKSTLILNKDLSAQPVWSEAFFMTLTHEMGHTLGLQHTLASSVMSTQITRAMSKASPLGDDDRAGLSALYPTPDFAARFGSISGRVTAGADGMNLASVVALTLDGIAVSALTNPDGTYRIEGLPPGNYFIYAHPLPPPLSGESYPANITPPTEIGGNQFPASGAFDSLFFPGVKQQDSASVVVVKAGEAAENMNFAVTRRAGVPVYAITTYSYPGGQVPVKPAYQSATYPSNFMIANGVGLQTASGAVAAGLTMSVMGSSAAVTGFKPYTSNFLQIDLQLYPIPGEGARHMIFRKDGDTHVLPAAFRVMAQNPPVVSEYAAVKDDAGQTFIEVRGSGFSASSRVYFDGVSAPVASATPTALRVSPPVAPTGHKAMMVILNADGQSSLFFTGLPQVFTYGDAADAGISLNTNTLMPGVETYIEVRGSGTAFNASTMVGFGSADVIVRRQWVLGPDRIVANVITLPGAAPGKSSVVVTNGLRSLMLPDGLQIAEAPARPVSSVSSAIVDDATGRAAISPGFTARAQLKGIAANLSSASFVVRVGGLAAHVEAFQDGFLVFRIPAALAPGPALTEITAAGEVLPSVLTPIDLPPPVVTGASSGTSAQPAVPGDLITFRVQGLTGKPEFVDPQSLVVLVGGVATKVVQSSLSVPGPGNDIQIVLDPKQGSGVAPVIVSLDGRASPPFTLFVK